MSLVEDLRHQAGCLDADVHGGTIDLLDAAADEVERLRARVEELEALLSDMPNAHADPMRDFYNRVLVALYRESGGEGEE